MPDLLIRSLGNETKIEILEDIQTRNNYDWYHIRDDKGREGWIQSIYVCDSRHDQIKHPSISATSVPTMKSVPTTIPIPTRTPVPTKKPIPTRTPVPTKKPTAIPVRITWRCYDCTSYNGNAYDDNKCISNTGEVRYVSDSQAQYLDPSYRPGKSGHPYYNSK